jgi:hypothetical protein
MYPPELVRANAHKKVFLINGPPNSGKDLTAVIARNFIDGKWTKTATRPIASKIMKFADPLKNAAHALYGIPYGCEYYEKEFGNDWKNTPQVEFYGATPRSEYIALSEEYAKRRHGEEVFGRVLARRIALEKQANVFLIPDSGFYLEAVPVIALVGLNNVIVVELTRAGCDFSSDSRSYVGDKLREQFPKLKVIRIPNSGDRDDLRLLVHGTMMKYLGVEA